MYTVFLSSERDFFILTKFESFLDEGILHLATVLC